MYSKLNLYLKTIFYEITKKGKKMQIEELHDLTNWINREVVVTGVSALYNDLLTVLNQNAQPSQTKLPFEAQKEALFTTLKTVSLSDLSSGQLEILENIGIAHNVGSEGVEAIEDVLYRNALDIATVVNKITTVVAEINTGVQWSSQINTLLLHILDVEEVRVAEDGVLMRIHFQKEAHLSNLTEFKDWGKTWYEIGRGITMANGVAPEDIKVVGASKGSIILTLLATYGIARTTSDIILAALKVAEKVYDIKKKAQEVKALKIGNDAAEKALEKAAADTKESGIKTIIADTIKQIGLDKKNEGDKVNALESSISKLVDFIEKGGEVDFVVPEETSSGEVDKDDPDVKARNDLRVIFKEVRVIEKKIQQIEFKDDN